MGFWNIFPQGGKLLLCPPFCAVVAPLCVFVVVKVTVMALSVCACVFVGLGWWKGDGGGVGGGWGVVWWGLELPRRSYLNRFSLAPSYHCACWTLIQCSGTLVPVCTDPWPALK